MHSVVALQRPDGGPDGLYMHYIDASGTISVKYLGNPGTTLHHRQGSLNLANTPRSVDSDVTCGGGYGSASDFINAEQALANFFGNGNSFYAKSVSFYSGSAAAFGCNYGHGQTCTAQQYLGDMQAVDDSCGASVAGWKSYPSSKSTYGRTLASESFC
jgi:hypothetical protein